MPTERIAMRRVREMLRLTLDAGLSVSEAARRMDVARSTLRAMLTGGEKEFAELLDDMLTNHAASGLVARTAQRCGFRADPAGHSDLMPPPVPI